MIAPSVATTLRILAKLIEVGVLSEREAILILVDAGVRMDALIRAEAERVKESLQ